MAKKKGNKRGRKFKFTTQDFYFVLAGMAALGTIVYTIWGRKASQNAPAAPQPSATGPEPTQSSVTAPGTAPTGDGTQATTETSSSGDGGQQQTSGDGGGSDGGQMYVPPPYIPPPSPPSVKIPDIPPVRGVPPPIKAPPQIRQPPAPVVRQPISVKVAKSISGW